MLVEFFGPPGVGKSTIAKLLYDSYADESVSVEQPTFRLAHEVGRLRSHAFKVQGVASSLRNSDVALPCGDIRNHPIGTVRAGYNWLFVSSLLLNHDRSKITVLDQGIIQAAWSYSFMAGNTNYNGMISEGICYSPTGVEHLVVSVDAPSQILQDRLNHRESGTEPAELTGTDESAKLESAIKICNDLETATLEVASDREDVTVIRIQNGGGVTPSSRAKEVRKAINEVRKK